MEREKWRMKQIVRHSEVPTIRLSAWIHIIRELRWRANRPQAMKNATNAIRLFASALGNVNVPPKTAPRDQFIQRPV